MQMSIPGFSIRSLALKAATLFFLMLLVAVTEGVGIVLFVPFLGWLSGDTSLPGFVQAIWKVFSFFGFSQSAAGVLLAFVLLVLLRSLIQLARDRLSVKLQHEVVDALRLACFTALLRVEWSWLIQNRKSDQSNLLLTNINRVGVGLQFGLALMVSSVTVIVYVVTAFAISWRMTLLVLCNGGLLFAIVSAQRHTVLSMGQKVSEANRALHASVQEALAGIKLTKILRNEQRHLALFKDHLKTVRQQHVAFVSNASVSRVFFQVGGAVLLGTMLYLGLTHWQTPIPELLTLVLIFSRLIPLFMAGQQQYLHCMHSLPALKETRLLMTECQQAAEPVAVSTSVLLVNRAIELKGVSFSYENRDAHALKQISVTFPARTTTAIMGPSGSGKSTLADVLMGLLVPQTGEMWVDSILVTGEARIRWRHSVAYVPQEIFLFHDTIRQNLLWGRPQSTDAELFDALHSASAGFVTQLPQGLDTVVGDGGSRLSGGERQRIALARALLSKPSLLILDEATSALDVENEAHIRAAIENLHGDLTVVIIGHRLMTLEHADQVLVLKEGMIIKHGTWQEINAVSA